MYPLADCIDFHKRSKIDTLWFDLLTYDAAYLHAVVFSCQAYASLINNRTPSAGASASAKGEMIHY
jgi:hypothetical protein